MCYIACLVGGQRFVFKEIARDDEFIEYLTRKEEEFWTQHVLKNSPPDFTGMDCDSEYVSRTYAEGGGGSIMPTSAIRLTLDEYSEICKKEKEIALQKERCANIIKDYMGEAEAIIDDTYDVTVLLANPVLLCTSCIEYLDCPISVDNWQRILYPPNSIILHKTILYFSTNVLQSQ